jgi:hypothetical protein
MKKKRSTTTLRIACLTPLRSPTNTQTPNTATPNPTMKKKRLRQHEGGSGGGGGGGGYDSASTNSSSAGAASSSVSSGHKGKKKRARGRPAATPAPYAAYAALRAQGLVPVSALNHCLVHDSLAGARAMAGKDVLKALEAAQEGLLQQGFLLLYIDAPPRYVFSCSCSCSCSFVLSRTRTRTRPGTHASLNGAAHHNRSPSDHPPPSPPFNTHSGFDAGLEVAGERLARVRFRQQRLSNRVQYGAPLVQKASDEPVRGCVRAWMGVAGR